VTTTRSSRLRASGFLAALLISAVAEGCVGSSPREVAFAEISNAKDLNSSIGLTPISTETATSSGLFLVLQLRNNASRSVGFPPGYGARAFIWSEASRSWDEVPNEITFPGVGYKLGPSGGKEPYIGTANFVSNDPRLIDAESVRVLVEGSLLDERGNADGAIAAYADVLLAGP